MRKVIDSHLPTNKAVEPMDNHLWSLWTTMTFWGQEHGQGEWEERVQATSFTVPTYSS